MHRRPSLIAPTAAVAASPLAEAADQDDHQALDWGTLGQRRQKNRSAVAGRLEHFPYEARRPGLGESAPYLWTAAATARGSAGRSRNWYRKKIAAWYGAPDWAWNRQAIAEVNKAAIDHMVYVPTGFSKGIRVGGKMCRAP